MDRSHQLESCKIRLNRKHDLRHGIICGLTNALAVFEDYCPDFKQDVSAFVEQVEKKEKKEFFWFKLKPTDSAQAIHKGENLYNLTPKDARNAANAFGRSIFLEIISIFKFKYWALEIAPLVSIVFFVIGLYYLAKYFEKFKETSISALIKFTMGLYPIISLIGFIDNNSRDKFLDDPKFESLPLFF